MHVAGERLHSERVDHHMPASLLGTLMNTNGENDVRDRGISAGTAAAARRMSERIARMPYIGNRHRARLGPSSDEEEGVGIPEEQSRGGQHNNRDVGGASPVGFFSQLIHQNPELSGVVKATEKYIPFLLIAAAKGFFDHATGT